MKHIAKQIVLFGAFAMLLSTMPMQAMEEAPADVQAEVKAKRGFFRQLSEKAKNSRLNYLMKQLKIEWKPFIKCVEKGEKDCLKQAQTISAIIKSILALVLVGTTIAIGAAIKRGLGRRTPATKLYTDADSKLISAAQNYMTYYSDESAKRINGLIGEIINKQPNLSADFFSANGLEKAREILAQHREIFPYWDNQIQILLKIKERPLEKVVVPMKAG